MSRILLLAFADDYFTPAQMAQIEDAAADFEVVQTVAPEKINARLPEIEVAAGRFPQELIPQAPALRWLQQWGAGADWLLAQPDVQGLDFILTNASGVHAVPISEHIFALLLAFARRLPDAVRAQDERVWIGNRWQKAHGTSIAADQKYLADFDKHDLFELHGQTLLIAGMGAIGARTARLAQAFDMHVIGMRRNSGEPVPDVDRLIGPEVLIATLPDADVVVNALPLTAATQDIFDAQAFAAMAGHAGYISIGRGGTTDEAALIAALQSGAIAWAGLDVFESEPLPPDSPLWSLANVLITPHYSGLTPEYDNRALAIFLDNLDRYQRGEPMRNVVDKRLGY